VYDVLPLSYFYLTLIGRAAPFYAIGTTPLCRWFLPAGHTVLTLPRRKGIHRAKPKRSYVMQTEFTIQQQVVPNLTVTALRRCPRCAQPFSTNERTWSCDEDCEAISGISYQQRHENQSSAGSMRYLNCRHTYYDSLHSRDEGMSRGFLFQALYVEQEYRYQFGRVGNTYSNSISHSCST